VIDVIRRLSGAVALLEDPVTVVGKRHRAHTKRKNKGFQVIQEFKDFVSKGGIFEAAVGLIMALAFVPVVDAIIEHILMPIIAAIVGEPNFDNIGIDIGDARIGVGFVITALISFLAVAAVVFMMVKAYNKATSPEEEDAGPTDSELLTQIRDALAK